MTTIKRYYQLMLALLLAGLAATAWLFMPQHVLRDLPQPSMRDAGFVLSALEIEGLQRTPRGAVVAAIDADKGTPILRIDLARLKDRIETLPWVKTASIKRVLPYGLQITIVERTPSALWQHNRQLSLIDRDGRVIPRAKLADFKGLPLLVGPGAEIEGVRFLEYVQRHGAAQGKMVQKIVRIHNRRWDIIFDHGMRLKLPAPDVDDADRRAWVSFVRLDNEKQVLARAIDMVDMRVEGRLIMRLSPDAAARMRQREQPA